MIIETERLILRRFQERDKEPFATINADPAVMRYFLSPLTRADSDNFIQRIENSWNDGHFHLLAAEVKEGSRFIGFIGLVPVPDEMSCLIPGNPKVEIGWRLHPAVWGKGLASEGALACLDYAWKSLHLDEIISFTSRLNSPSQRVMEKIGMTRVPEDDFEHPKVPVDHELRPHVLYRIKSPL